MKEAIISDIHGNLEAFEAVLADISKRGLTHVICLGDVVGYGANPAECMDLAMKLEVCLMGNHEWAVLNEALGFHQAAKQAIEYAKGQLKPGFFSGSHKRERWEYIKNLPDRHVKGKYLFVHGSPASPVEEYILKQEVDEMLGEYTKKVALAFEKTDFVAIIGHTHTPGIVTSDAKFITPEKITGAFKFEPPRKYIANVGSVGQPRDGNWHACYAILDREADTIEYARVPYDVEAAMRKIMKAGLHEHLSTRLKQGA
jgi:diadenosine tetraphosphatase ApaH/serine/threonine PP2A family protein phosphatase